MPNIQEIINDPDFLSLPTIEQSKVLDTVDVDYKALPPPEKAKVLQQLSVPQKKPSGAGGSFGIDSGFVRSPAGQLQYRPPATPSVGVGRAGPVVLGGLSRLARGAVPLPFDIAAALGSEKAERFADIIRKNIPEIPPETTVEEMGQVLVQYGVPGTTAVKWAGRVLAGSHKAIKYIGQIISGGLADIGAAIPEEKPLVDYIAKPKEGESVLARKAKIGAEGAIIPPVLHGTTKGISWASKKVGRFTSPLFRPGATAKSRFKEAFAKSVIDSESAIKNIDEAIELSKGTDFRPTTGTATGDIGAVVFEKGAATGADTSVWFQQRVVENKAAIAKQLDMVTQGRSGSPEHVQSYFQTFRKDLLAQAEKGIESASNRLSAVREETANTIAQFAEQGGRQADASTVINEALEAQLSAMTRTKSALYAGIDPDNTVELIGGKARIGLILNNNVPPYGITIPRSPLDSTPDKLPRALIDRIEGAIHPTEAPPLTFGALQDLRPDLSEAITAARDADQGGVVVRLIKLKNAVDMEAEYLAEQGGDAATRAAKANTYFKEEYVPRFKQWVGDAFRAAQRKRKPIPPTGVAQKFLGAPIGARESAKQLKVILKDAPNQIAAEAAISDYIIADVADLLTDASGKVNKARLDRYLKSKPIRETLRQFPELQKDLHAFRNSLGTRLELENAIAKDVTDAQQVLRQTQKQLTQSATKFFVNSDPVNAIGRAIRSADPVQSVDELVKLANQDPTGQARKGLQVALSEHLQNTLRGTREVGGHLEVLQSKVSRLLDTPTTKKALSKIYSEQEMEVLERLQKQLRIMDRINVQVTSGSVTAPLQQDIQRARIVLASWYGIVKGRGIFAISRWIQEGLGIDPIKTANQVLLDAMLDPEVAKAMLVKDIPKNRKFLERFFINYRAHNILRPEEERP